MDSVTTERWKVPEKLEIGDLIDFVDLLDSFDMPDLYGPGSGAFLSLRGPGTTTAARGAAAGQLAARHVR